MNQSPIQLKDQTLNYVMPVLWDDVFGFWRFNEEKLPHWIQYWHSKGFESWEQWRQEKVDHFGFVSLYWYYYKIVMPYISIPAFRGGPFKGWQEKFYKGLNFPTFEELANDHSGIQQDEGISKYLIDFPAQTTLTGIVLDGHVIIMEGMHRCAALSLVARKGITLNIEHDIQICLAQWPQDQPLVPMK